MTYTAERTNTGYIVMLSNGAVIASRLTEAQASIITFALNAVARGRQLGHRGVGGQGFIHYDGPTEGVAP